MTDAKAERATGWTRTESGSLSSAPIVKRLIDACVRMGSFQPHELLRWLVDDVLAGFGLRPEAPPNSDAIPWLCENTALYAEAVIRHPFGDVLGMVYQVLSSHGHRGALGQFFTPASVSRLIAEVLMPAFTGVDDKERPDRLLRACEPACGSGAMVLAFMEAQLAVRGCAALRRWSITGIDLDPLCSRMCAAQILANLYAQRLELGELVIYRGNALGPREGLSVVVHTTVADLTPDIVLPAMHPSRIEALRMVAAGHAAVQPKGSEQVTTSGRSAVEPDKVRATNRPSSADAVGGSTVDLFAD
jgi:hypothetical protein